jgi:hypothetical protein
MFFPPGRIVVAGILPAVEGGILPPGRTVGLEKIFASSKEVWLLCGFFRRAGWCLRTATRQDACHYHENLLALILAFSPREKVACHPLLKETIVAWESNDRNSALPEARKGRASGRERVSAGERTVKRLNIEDKSGSAREILFSV